jgi:hypothetical protein
MTIHLARRESVVALGLSSSLAVRGPCAAARDAGDWVPQSTSLDPAQTVSADFAKDSKTLIMSRAKTWRSNSPMSCRHRWGPRPRASLGGHIATCYKIKL